jgi:hypothetical protein
LRRSNYDLSTVLVAIGAVAVLISLFLDWYGDPGQNAFSTFELTDWLFVALAVGALVVIGTESWSGGGTPNNRLAWICGALAFLVIVQVIDPPPAARGNDREIGAWIALAGAALMVTGAVLAMAQISVTIDVAERERRRRTAAVDARGDGTDDPSEAPTTASASADRGASRAAGTGLWQAPAAPDAPPPAPDARSSTPSSEPKAPGSEPKPPTPGPGARAATPGSAPKPPTPGPTSDPDRTQPMTPLDRPEADAASTEGEDSSGAGDGDAKS